MSLELYNTLTRRVEKFTPQNPEKVKLYTCGPTVYSSPHIGNYTAYVYWDLLIRVLKLNDYIPYRVLNLTDVGHLTSDGDEGEDKLEKGAKKSGSTVWEIAERYIDEFKSGYSALELTPPEVWARATDYIKYDIKIIEILTKKGFTYETSDGIYYDTHKFPHYADFAHLDLSGLKAGARVKMSVEKHNLTDFALWKFIQPGENHAMRWDYLDRPGYPGWHLECSTIIHQELGEPIDIHTGGIDHIPVHHTNEIAQSEAAFEKPLARFWLHCNHLTSEGQKLSKSLGNGYTLEDLREKGFSPLDFKMWVLQGHYRSERDFSFTALSAAKNHRLSWRNRIARCYQDLAPQNSEDLESNLKKLRDTLNRDLNSAAAFALIDSWEEIGFELWEEIDHIFGLGLIADSPRLSSAQEELLTARQHARAEKDYALSDRLRDQLLASGISVLDTAEGQIWQYSN